MYLILARAIVRHKPTSLRSESVSQSYHARQFQGERKQQAKTTQTFHQDLANGLVSALSHRNQFSFQNYFVVAVDTCNTIQINPQPCLPRPSISFFPSLSLRLLLRPPLPPCQRRLRDRLSAAAACSSWPRERSRLPHRYLEKNWRSCFRIGILRWSLMPMLRGTFTHETIFRNKKHASPTTQISSQLYFVSLSCLLRLRSVVIIDSIQLIHSILGADRAFL